MTKRSAKATKRRGPAATPAVTPAEAAALDRLERSVAALTPEQRDKLLGFVHAPPLSDQLRDAIDGCGLTRYKLAQITGVSQPALCRFMKGQTGLGLKAIDALGRALGLELRPGLTAKGR